MGIFSKLILFVILGVISLMLSQEPYLGIGKSIIIFSEISFSLLVLTLLVQKRIRIPKIFPLFILFIIWMIISLTYSRNINDSIWEILRITSFFSLFFVMFNLIYENKKLVRSFLVFFILFGIVLLLKDLYGFIGNSGLKNAGLFQGSLVWHNQMAGFLLFLIPINLSLLIKSKPLQVRLLFASSFFIALFAMLLTYSRGGWISLFISLIFFVAINIKKIQKSARIVLPIFFVFIIILLLVSKPSRIIERVNALRVDVFSNTKTVSGDLRTSVWQNSIKMFASSPVLGIGPGAFGSTYFNFQSAPWLYSKYAHNYFLEILVELGVPGLLIFLSILLVMMRSFYEKKKKIFGNPLLVGITVALIASFVHTLIDVDFSRIALYSLFWSFLAILLASVEKDEIVLEMEGNKKLIQFIPLILMILPLLLALSSKQYKTAINYYNNEDFQKAEKALERATLLDPFNAKNYLLLGKTKKQQGDRKSARDFYNKARSISPYDTNIYYSLGALSFEEKKYNESKQLFIKAIEMAPYGNLSAYNSLAFVYANLKEKKMTEQTLKTAINKAFPLDKSFMGLEYIYTENGFKKDLAEIYIKLIFLEAEFKNKDEAKKLLTVVEKNLDPQNPLLPFLRKNVVK